jgi:hypothetical protein
VEVSRWRTPHSLDVREAKVGHLGHVIDIIGLSNISNATDIYKDKDITGIRQH